MWYTIHMQHTNTYSPGLDSIELMTRWTTTRLNDDSFDTKR